MASVASNPSGFVLPEASNFVGGGGDISLWPEVVVLYSAKGEEKEIARREKERSRGRGFFIFCHVDHFVVAKNMTSKTI